MEQRSKFTIRTSDRRVFRRCLRKWDFQSSLRQNLTHKGTEQNINFWFGSGIHFALEDWHGWNRFKDPRRAFYAYYKAFPENELPLGAESHYELGMAMLSYYLTWLERHNEGPKFKTAWFYDDMTPAEEFAEGAHPAVEQQFYIPLGVYAVVSCADDTIFHTLWEDENHAPDGALLWKPEYEGYLDRELPYNDVADLLGLDMYSNVMVKIVPIYYHGTIDKIMVDCYGRYWLCDYKTAKGADTNKLATDDQVSAYMWAVSKVFPFPVRGFVYLQMTKEAVQEPRRLKNGDLSVDKKQKTTYSLLKQEIIKDYGSVQDAPNKLIQFLNHLAAAEAPEGDRFIRWDFVERTPAQVEATERHIYGELRHMLDPDMYCYPSPTRDCIWDCPFRDICIAMDKDDNDYCYELLQDYEPRPRNEDGNIDPWRENIKWPESEDDLLPLDQILNFDQCMTIELESRTDNTSGFQFMYEEEDC